MSLKVTAASYFFNDGYLTLEVVVNDQRVWLDQSNRLMAAEGLISLGSEFENDAAIPVINLPEDRQRGRSALRLKGFTADARLQALFRQYVSDVDNDRFREQPLTLTAII